MKVIVIEPKEGQIYLHETEGQLRDFQELVGGYIETCAPVELRNMGIQMLCNEEGLLRGLECNLNLFPFFYVGTLVMVGVRGDEFVSLNEKQQMYAMKWLRALAKYQ